MKQVQICVTVNRWVSVPDDYDEADILGSTDGILDGIDLDLWEANDPELLDQL